MTKKQRRRKMGMVKEGMSRPWPLIILVTLLFVFGGDASVTRGENSGGTEKSDSLTVETILSGPSSAYPARTPALLLIKDADDWAYVWNLHQGEKGQISTPPVQDFTLFSVIALFGGQSSVVEKIRITGVELHGDTVRVSAVQVEPEPTCGLLRTSRNAYHMVRVPALPKNLIPSLEIEILTRHCTG